MADPLEPALARRFSVKVGQLDIGLFTACTGLEAKYEVEEWREGGNPGFVHRLPIRVVYTDVTLTRPVDKDSARIAAWFTEMLQALKRETASIKAYDGNGTALATWNLVGVWPLRYAGPQLNSTSAQSATETLVLAHNGFTLEAA